MSVSLWKNRDFAWFVSGQTVSQFGTAMTTFVIPWLFLQRTGSAVQTGLAFAASFVPYILMSLPAGVWADRRDRKTLMILADCGRLLLLLTIPVTHAIGGSTPIALLYGVQAGVGGLSAVFDAAYGAAIPNLVAYPQLQEANNTLQTGRSLSRILGPIVGGMTMAWIGSADALLVDSVTYVVSLITLRVIGRSLTEVHARAVRQSFRRDVQLGIGTVWRLQPVRYLMFLAGLVNLVGPGMDVALLYRINHELHLGSRWSAVIMAGLSGGMLLGSLLNRRLAHRIPMNKLLVASSLLQVGPPLVLALTQSPLILALTQVFVGMLLVVMNVQSVSLRQMLIPDNLRGRCTSVFRMVAWFSIPAGDALAGVINQAEGTAVYFIIADFVLLGVAILAVRVRLEWVGGKQEPSASPQSGGKLGSTTALGNE
jgi:MFS family permease